MTQYKEVEVVLKQNKNYHSLGGRSIRIASVDKHQYMNFSLEFDDHQTIGMMTASPALAKQIRDVLLEIYPLEEPVVNKKLEFFKEFA